MAGVKYNQRLSAVALVFSELRRERTLNMQCILQPQEVIHRQTRGLWGPVLKLVTAVQMIEIPPQRPVQPRQ